MTTTTAWEGGYDASTWHADPTTGEDDLAEDALTWCDTCEEWAEMTPLTEDIAESEIDESFPQGLCEGCGYVSPLNNEPEPEACRPA